MSDIGRVDTYTSYKTLKDEPLPEIFGDISQDAAVVSLDEAIIILMYRASVDAMTFGQARMVVNGVMGMLQTRLVATRAKFEDILKDDSPLPAAQTDR